jgi:hypothetical protein
MSTGGEGNNDGKRGTDEKKDGYRAGDRLRPFFFFLPDANANDLGRSVNRVRIEGF